MRSNDRAKPARPFEAMDETGLRLADDLRTRGHSAVGKQLRITQSGFESLPCLELDSTSDEEPVAWLDRFLPPDQIQIYYNKNLAAWDTDGSGSISKSETARALEIAEGHDFHCADILDEHFNGIDANRNGEISPAEIQLLHQEQKNYYQALNTEKAEIEIVKTNFNKIDTDQNQRLTQAEFNDAARIDDLSVNERSAFAEMGSSDNYKLLTSRRHAEKGVAACELDSAADRLAMKKFRAAGGNQTAGDIVNFYEWMKTQ